MTRSAIIIGNGISGLLLAHTLLKKQWEVTIISEPGKDPGDSPLICPEMVISYLEEILPGAGERLVQMGAHQSSHREMVITKFPSATGKSSGDFLFLSRKLFLEYLNEKTLASGIRTLEVPVTELLIQNESVAGVIAGDQELRADCVFDCTGSYRARSKWLKKITRKGEVICYSGVQETMFLRFFESEKKPELKLRSGDKFRGGIYPVEHNRFAVSMIIPTDNMPVDPDNTLKEFISFIGADNDFSGSTTSGRWIKRDNITNYYSDFHHRRINAEVKNFYAIGDGILFSNPIYGRGIALIIYQLRELFKHSDMATGVWAGYGAAFKKWSEVSKEKKSFPYRVLRKYYLYLLEREPVVYEAFLEFYQLRITPMKLLKAVMLSPLSIKILSLTVLFLSALAWASLFYLQ